MQPWMLERLSRTAAGADRHRRGPLRQPVGPRLPARVPDAGPAGRAVPRASRAWRSPPPPTRARARTSAPNCGWTDAASSSAASRGRSWSCRRSASAAQAHKRVVELVDRAAGPLRRGLCRLARRHRQAGRGAARRPASRRWPITPASTRQLRDDAAGAVPRGRRRGDGGDHRLRHGRRQAGRPLRDPRRSAGLHRGLLAGDRPRRARRRPGRGHHPLWRRRHGLGAAPHRRARRRRRRSSRCRSRKVRQLYAMLDGTGCRAGRRAPLLRRGGRRAPAASATSASARRRPTDATEAAQKALSAAHRLGGRFGRGRLVDHLLGKTKDVTDHEAALSTWGIGQELQRRRLARPDRPAAVRGPAARGPQRRPAAGRARRRRGGARGLSAASGGSRCADAEAPRRRPARAAPRKRARRRPLALSPRRPAAVRGAARLARRARPRASTCRPMSSSTTAPWPRSPPPSPAAARRWRAINGVGEGKLARYGEAVLEVVRGFAE